MNNKILKDIKKYIERTQIKIDGEWGDCRTLKKLIKDNMMPYFYFDILKLINGKKKNLKNEVVKETVKNVIIKHQREIYKPLGNNYFRDI